jgi:AhpD family alkylhydroperoxidase
MTEFTVHTVESAPEGAKETLAQVRTSYGFLPNLAGVMAEAPALLKGYVSVFSLFSTSSLSPTQQQIVLLATSRANGCDYCMAAHSLSARRGGLSQEMVEAILNEEPLSDSGLEALRRLTQSIVESRGFPKQLVIEEFLEAGYTRANILEVILGVGLKTLSNYTNHIAEPPLDEVFRTAPRNMKARG